MLRGCGCCYCGCRGCTTVLLLTGAWTSSVHSALQVCWAALVAARNVCRRPRANSFLLPRLPRILLALLSFLLLRAPLGPSSRSRATPWASTSLSLVSLAPPELWPRSSAFLATLEPPPLLVAPPALSSLLAPPAPSSLPHALHLIFSLRSLHASSFPLSPFLLAPLAPSFPLRVLLASSSPLAFLFLLPLYSLFLRLPLLSPLILRFFFVVSVCPFFPPSSSFFLFFFFFRVRHGLGGGEGGVSHLPPCQAPFVPAPRPSLCCLPRDVLLICDHLILPVDPSLSTLRSKLSCCAVHAPLVATARKFVCAYTSDVLTSKCVYASVNT